MSQIKRYGVNEQTVSLDTIDRSIEEVKLRGFSILDSGYEPEDLEHLSQAFTLARSQMEERFGGRESLARIDEHNTIRVPMAYQRKFLDLALNPVILDLCKRMLGDHFILNQQNGISNPGDKKHYNQAAFHRDLPYQHFVSDRPLAINALFCLNDFTKENGATLVIPGSHKLGAFPSDDVVEILQQQIEAPAGSFIVLDCMLFHSGAPNETSHERLAVNHVYSIPLLKQQIDLPGVLGENFTQDAKIRQILGYDTSTPSDIESYYKSRRKKLKS
jgi:ectoine hydroxylase-related dioxygenase (phytanoyl-CoA dioxygenase family)